MLFGVSFKQFCLYQRFCVFFIDIINEQKLKYVNFTLITHQSSPIQLTTQKEGSMVKRQFKVTCDHISFENFKKLLITFLIRL